MKKVIFFSQDVRNIILKIFLFLGDGIFDRLNNDQIINEIWEAKKLGQIVTDIHSFCGKITDTMIKNSIEKNSVDNVSFVFIAFKIFENKLKYPNFVKNLGLNAKKSKKIKLILVLLIKKKQKKYYPIIIIYLYAK